MNIGLGMLKMVFFLNNGDICVVVKRASVELMLGLEFSLWSSQPLMILLIN